MHGSFLTLTLPSELYLLPVARNFVDSVCHAAGLDKADGSALVLCANEAIGNAIRHGNKGRPTARVTVTCHLTDEAVEICVHDEGDSFRLDDVPRLDPSEIRPGGRGIYLMRKLMDELSSHPREGGGNVVRMVKRCRRHSDMTHTPLPPRD